MTARVDTSRPQPSDLEPRGSAPRGSTVAASDGPGRGDRDRTIEAASLLGPAPYTPPPTADATVLTDLNLDQAFRTITTGREEYDLLGIFSAPLLRARDVQYRQAVFRDLERPEVRASADGFAAALRTMRAARDRSTKMRNEFQRARWFLEAADQYCRAIRELSDALDRISPASDGFRSTATFLRGYRSSPAYRQLESETRQLVDELSRVRYGLLIQGDRITVRPFADDPDLGREIDGAFRRFRDEPIPDKGYRFPDHPEMNHVEESIQERVALLFPREFARLREYPSRHPEFVDPGVARLDREIQFFLAYLDAVAKLRGDGRICSYPEILDGTIEVSARATFDLALALQFSKRAMPIVPNDVQLSATERILVVTGPNNGGKTTFARMFGQLHHLAALGGPVPGESVRLALCDRVYTHFERGEAVADLRGKLLDELVRLRAILDRATPRSVLVLNETFGSATVQDGLHLGEEILRRVIDRGARCVYVTFLDELSTLAPSVVSVVSTVRPDDPAVRTYRLIRQPADGRAYAFALARKHGLTYEALRERFGS